MKRFKILWIILGVIVVLVGGGFIFANYMIDSTLDKITTTETLEKEEAEISEEVIAKEEESQVVNIAIFGVDKNGDQTDGRSDAMKVLSLDAKNNVAKITSIQRDTLIYIPGVKQDFEKLNHAYAYGGATLAMQTINYNFDLDLTRYVAFNFEGVQHVIDAMGGIELEIKEYEVPYISNVSKSGYQHLSGEQALAYMRVRYADSDYVRMDRQTTVMKAMFSKLTTLGYTELLSLLNDCLPYVETNLTKDEILSLGMQALKVDLGNIQTYQVPRGGYEDINHTVSYNGYSPLYVMNSYQDMVKELHQGIYGDDNYEPSQTVKDTEGNVIIQPFIGNAYSGSLKFYWFKATITFDSTKDNTITFKTGRTQVNASFTSRFLADEYYFAVDNLMSDRTVYNLTTANEAIRNFYHSPLNMVTMGDTSDGNLGFANVNGETVKMGSILTATVDVTGATVIQASFSIRSATVAQKIAAEIEEVSDTQYSLLDVNLDGNVDVRDATLMQKALVNA